MDINLFDFNLPEKLIAQTPLKSREESRLLVVDKKTGDISHEKFPLIIDYLQPGDALVLNQTKVMPARLYGEKEDTKATVEVLLLQQHEDDLWETLVKPAKRIKKGSTIIFGDGYLKATCDKIGKDGIRFLKFQYKGIFYEVLEELGEMPLPPYIKERLDDKDRYQTVYAKEIGSAAAPTAGLHFTESLLKKIKDKGVHLVFVTLHVGLGTFRPVAVENISDHEMHSEYYQMSSDTANILNKVKENNNRIIAVGTTSIRTVETVASNNNGKFVTESGWTSIFIYPGYKFKAVDNLITNFHLPKSTLIMLVSALAGRENILHAYNQAIKEEYRFFSFGDAMLIK